jgi:hypothetical protein
MQVLRVVLNTEKVLRSGRSENSSVLGRLNVEVRRDERGS